MTALRISIALLIILVLSSLFFNKILNNTSNNIVTQLEQLEESIKQDNWNKAQIQMTAIQKSWEDAERWMATLIDHHEIDNIKMTLSRANQFVRYKKNADFMAESAVLKHLINHIPAMEKINFANLF